MKYLNLILGNVLYVIMVVFWIAGFVIAKGAWSTMFCIFPFYAWYLVIEKAMIAWGLV